MCEDPNEKCYLSECPSCKDKDLQGYKNLILNSFRELEIPSVTVQQWEGTDRSNIVSKTKKIDDFVSDLFKQLYKLKEHHYISKSQSEYLQELKQNLQPDELIIGGDFAENFQFVIQDAIQSSYWSTDSATIFPWIVYHKEGDELKNSSYVMISDDLSHKTEAVATFQSKLIDYLKGKHPNVKKVYYFSDGCGGQFKNCKNFSNLIHHKLDYGLDAEWHFFATSHGKGPYDGIGGGLKRACTNYCLGKIYQDQITTPYQMFEWAQKHMTNIKVFYVNQFEVKSKLRELKERFDSARKVHGTRSYHSFIPIPENLEMIRVKRISKSSSSEVKRVMH